MTIPRYKARDENEREVIEWLEVHGWVVQRLEPPAPDLVVAKYGITHLAEVKNPEGRGMRLTEAQETFRKRWKNRGCIHTEATKEAMLQSLEDCRAGR